MHHFNCFEKFSVHGFVTQQLWQTEDSTFIWNELWHFIHYSKVSSKSTHSQVKISWLAPMASREGKKTIQIKITFIERQDVRRHILAQLASKHSLFNSPVDTDWKHSLKTLPYSYIRWETEFTELYNLPRNWSLKTLTMASDWFSAVAMASQHCLARETLIRSSPHPDVLAATVQLSSAELQ